ncbi:MAG: carboxypeptidase-like regulatory domain-containing protein, partial [Sphingobacterium sp.]
MKTFVYNLSLLVTLLVLTNPLRANDTIRVTGKVMNADNNEAIPFASIYAIGAEKQLGTQSDEHGEYILELPNNIKKIKISSVGFQSEEYPVSEETDQRIRVLLFPSNSIEEIV